MTQENLTRAPLDSGAQTTEWHRAKRARRLRDDLEAYAFLGPFLAIFIVFTVAPAIFGVGISFMKWDILGTPSWRGIGNYVRIFNDPMFIASIINTFKFMLLTVIPLVTIGLALAMLLNAGLRGTVIARTIIFMPYVITVSAVGILWVWIYDGNTGLINYYLSLLGIAPILWLTEKGSAMIALAITTVWWTVNVNMIIYLAGLQDIPRELYEAAQLDGANGWEQFKRVTLPLLGPVHAFVVPLTVIGAWRVFGQVYVMTKGGPEASTFVMAQYTYLTAFQNFEMGPAAASAVVLLLITLVFSLIQLRAFKVL